MSDLAGHIASSSPDAAHAIDRASDAATARNFAEARTHLANAAAVLQSEHGSMEDVTAIHDAARQLSMYGDSGKQTPYLPMPSPPGGLNTLPAPPTQSARDFMADASTPYPADMGVLGWQGWNAAPNPVRTSKHEHALYSDPVAERLHAAKP